MLPEEPQEPRAETRAHLEDSPEEGARRINAGHPLTDLLWEEWGAELRDSGMDRDRFDEKTRGYAGEIRGTTASPASPVASSDGCPAKARSRGRS